LFTPGPAHFISFSWNLIIGSRHGMVADNSNYRVKDMPAFANLMPVLKLSITIQLFILLPARPNGRERYGQPGNPLFVWLVDILHRKQDSNPGVKIILLSVHMKILECNKYFFKLLFLSNICLL
jgi:hypothetical protein